MNTYSAQAPLDPIQHQRRFFERFANRTLMIHEGFPTGWFEELLKQPGGGGHFRIDTRIAPGSPPTPVEWVVHGFVLPLDLPKPLLMRIDRDCLYLRHLQKNGYCAHPSELLWMLDDIRERYHACLHVGRGTFEPSMGIPLTENSIETPYGAF